MSMTYQLVNGFIHSELECFKKQFDESPVPQIQDTRSMAIAWLSYYFKDIISRENVSAITKFADKVQRIKNYGTHGWYRIPALLAAAFALTSQMRFANALIRHIDCEQGWAREFFIACTGIICPLLPFSNRQLKKAVEANLRYHQGLYRESTLLYLCTVGHADEKKEWLQHQINSVTDQSQRQFLMQLQSRGSYSDSDFFVRSLSEVKSYLIFNILSSTAPYTPQPGLFGSLTGDYTYRLALEKRNPLYNHPIAFNFLCEAAG